MSLLTKDEDATSESLLSKKRRTLRGIYDGVRTRHVLALMGFLGFVNVYALRVNLSVALVAMVNHTAILSNSTPTSGEECRTDFANSTNEKMQVGVNGLRSSAAVFRFSDSMLRCRRYEACCFPHSIPTPYILRCEFNSFVKEKNSIYITSQAGHI